MKKSFCSLLLASLMLFSVLPFKTISAELNGVETDSGFNNHSAPVRNYSWNQIPSAILAYLKNVSYDSNDYTTSRIEAYAPSSVDGINTGPVGLPLLFPSGTLERNKYVLAVNDGMITIYNDIPNQITPYMMRSTSGEVVQSGMLMPNGGALRMIKCPRAVNVRDLGGWTCDGGTVRYGMLFRGGKLTKADREVILDQLGVLHELDLRGRDEAAREPSVLKDAIDYTVFDRCAWYSLTDTALWRQMLRVVFDCVNRGSPLYFHCAIGADRTGTLACVLEALLGISQSDIDKDYELTCFATGTGNEGLARRRNEADWRRLIQQINGKTGDTFRDKVVQFVLELGFSLDEINAFRSSMVEGTPELLVPSENPMPAPMAEPSPKATAKDNPFVDVALGKYYTDAVLWAINQDPQITTGTTETTFSPDSRCTRCQMLTFLWRAAGCPEPKEQFNPFEDVKNGDYYFKAVLWAVEKGITNGTGASTFSPQAPVTRGQTMTFLWRMAGEPRTIANTTFRDVSADQFYAKAVLWAEKNEITYGISDTTFAPNNPCSRAQIVTFLYRAMV